MSARDEAIEAIANAPVLDDPEERIGVVDATAVLDADHAAGAIVYADEVQALIQQAMVKNG